MSQHYVLVSKEACPPLKIVDLKEDGVVSKDRKDDYRDELIAIYETYADMYPNPKLAEEMRQRNTLLQAARAAATFQHDQHLSSKKKNKRSGGFLSFLFGSSSPEDENNEDETSSAVDSSLSVAAEDMLAYKATINPLDDGSLCATQQSIDVACIPEEVYSVARWHLTSTRTRRDRPNALRCGPSMSFVEDKTNNNDDRSSGILPQHQQASSSMWIVVGLGEIAEFHDNTQQQGEFSRITTTSDREELMGYAERTGEFDLHAVRGGVLSPNCIAISWGFLDGVTVFYRRIRVPGYLNGEGWEAVWMIGPASPVLKNLTAEGQDLFHDDQEQPGSPLLRISDCLPLPVQLLFDEHQHDAQQEHHHHVPSKVITLAISRLGGYIELVPLPTKLWTGSVLTTDNYRPPKHNARGTSKAKRKRGQHQQHYAAGKNLSCPLQTVALTTCDHHIDVQALEAYRTTVNSETVWDNQAFPHYPPSEFVLAASGVSRGGIETLTFWTVSTVFPETPNPQDEIGFELHSSLIDAVSAMTGSPVSIFATPRIMDRWRTPRQVELNNTKISTDAVEFREEHVREESVTPVTTVSTSAPIVSMHFSDSDGSTSTHSGPFLSVLDWNGGVQIFDCSVMGRVAAQNMPLHEYEQYRHAKEQQEQQQKQVTFALVTSIISRNQFSVAIQRVAAPSVANLHWLGCGLFGPEGTMPTLVLLMEKTRTMVLATFKHLSEDKGISESPDVEPFKSSTLSLIFPSTGATIMRLDDGNLAFVASQRGRLKSSHHHTRLLKYIVMVQLQPVAIVETLARDSKFEEAIESASKLSTHEYKALADVVGHCHRQLWETQRNVQSLKATNDVSYITRQALLICDESSSCDGMTLEKLHSVLNLALACSDGVQVNGKIGKIREILVRLGSYELLCRHFGSRPLLQQFQKEFLIIDVGKLSEQIARRADVAALSIVLFRHRRNVGPTILRVLSSLPFSLNPDSYCHLLPILRNGSFSDYFLAFSSEKKTNDISPWSHMPRYLSETEGTSLVLGLFDEKVVLQYNKCSFREDIELFDNKENLVADWFLARTKLTQTFIGNIDKVIRLSAVGLLCVSPGGDESNLDQASVAVRKLHNTWQSALSLQRMILDEVVSINGDGIDTDSLIDMSLVQLLDLVLNSETDTSRILYKFKEYVQPLMLEMTSSGNDDASRLDEALASYCITKARRSSDSPLPVTKLALASCAAVAQCSKTSIPMRDRLIKRQSVLIEIVLTSSKNILKALSQAAVSMGEQHEIIEDFWRLYEALPSRLSEEELIKEAAISSFYQLLVAMDILTRWPGCRPFVSTVRLQDSMNSSPEKEFEHGNHVILEIINAFKAVVFEIASEQDKMSLLSDLLSDVESLIQVYLGSSVDAASIVCSTLIPDLMEHRNFHLVAACLSWSGPSVDSKQVERVVLDYVDEAVFSEYESVEKFSHAIHCHDILGPLLPGAQSSFQSIRRYLDASNFISTVVFDGNDVARLNPLDLKSMSAMDSVETVLRSVPESVVCGCPQWMDSGFALEANKVLREAEASPEMAVDETSKPDFPILPGGAIFHLAAILGLEDSGSALAVRCRVIHYALKCEFYGAAAAIARTLVYVQTFGSSSNDAIDLVKLAAIADVVSERKYFDQTTKKELCDATLCRFQASVTVTNSTPFDKILRTSAFLDVSLSRFNQDFHELSPARKAILLSRPLARLYKHIFYEYSSDIHKLSLDLVKQTEEQEVHDSLMNALSRFVFYWCIHDSKALKRFVDLWGKADANDNLALGCSLILQIPSRLTATNCVHELQKIAADQAANVAMEERFGATENSCLPDPGFVRRLIDRGYSENAARRAVMMTGNSGFNDALGWAVMHTMDLDFNQPLAITKPTNRMCIDDDAIKTLQKSLVQVSNVLEDPSQLAALLRYIERQYQRMESIISKSGSEIPGNQKSKVESLQSGSVTQKATQPLVTSNTGRPSQEGMRPPLQNILEQRGSLPTNVTNGMSSNCSPKPQELPATQIIENTPKIQQHPRPPPSQNLNVHSPTPSDLQLKQEQLQRRVTTIQANSDGSHVRGDVTPNYDNNTASKSADCIVLDRDELRKRGQAALEKLRNTVRTGSRRRLIEEGRQLLNQSRSTNACAATTANGNSHMTPRRVLQLPPSDVRRPSPTSSAPPPKQSIEPSFPRPASSVVSAPMTSKPKTASRGSATKVTKIDPIEDVADSDGWDFDDF